MKTATFVGDPLNDGQGKGRIVMKKPHTLDAEGNKVILFPGEGVVFKMNVPTEVTDAQHAFLRGHNHFEVSSEPGEETPPPAEGVAAEDDEGQGEGEEE